MRANGDIEGRIQRSSASTSQKELFGVTPRVLVLALILIIVISIIQVRGWNAQLGPFLNEFEVPNTGGLAVIFILLLVNAVLKKRERQFRPHEIVIIYVVVSFIIMVAGLGFIANMANALMGPWYQVLSGTSQGQYEEFIDRLPAFVMPKDQTAAIEFWMGGASGVPWGQWIMPIITWTVVTTAILFLLLCLSNIVREFWTYREHLTYPLTQPVLQTFTATQEYGNLWRNKIALAGMIIAAVLGIINILHSYFPVIPQPTLVINLGQYFTERPWNALADWPPHFNFGFSPLHIGIAYILPVNVSFSFWFFALFYKMENITMNALGYYDTHAQNTLWWSWAGLTRAAGAYVAIALFALWRARHAIKEIVLVALGRMQRDESNEALSSKTTIFGGIAALLFVLLFMKVLVGVPIYGTLALLLCFFAYAVAIARLRAEAGLPRSLAQPLETNEFSMSLLGGAWFHPGVRGTGLLFYLSYGSAPSMSAWMLEGYKMADQVNLKRKSMTKIILLTYVLAAIFAFGVFLYFAYDYGAAMFEQGSVIRAAGYNAWTKFDNYTEGHKLGTNKYLFANAQFKNHIIGFVFATFLSIMNSRFVWWPFHPVGYAYGLNTDMPGLWSFYFVAWLIKVLTIRFGGYETAKKIYPFFIGLVIGSAGITAIHSVIGIIFPTL